LGYGLSDSLRRSGTPKPPEPCRLPLAAIQIRQVTQCYEGSKAFSVGEWERSWTDEEYAAAIEAMQEAIARGDAYQVNLVQHLSAPFCGDPASLAERLAPLRPLHGRPLFGDGWAMVSASPELFLSRRGRRVWTMPIKGTRARGEEGLLDSEKDAAEH